MTDLLIGLDIGTSGVKALLIDATGTVVGRELRSYPLSSPRPNWAEQNPQDWVNASLDALTALAAAVPSGLSVKAIGLTGQMHGSVFLDKEARVLRPALLWCDQRTAAQCESITEKAGGEAALVEMVSNPALTGFTAPKILWFRDEEPDLYERLDKVLLPKDYIRYVLTGEFATDVSDASGTLLFDVKNRCWHKGLMSKLDLDNSLMPDAFEGPEVTGTLTLAMAEKTGLPAGIPVVAGGGDQAAGGVGCGIVRPGTLSSALGTSGVVFAFADTVTVDPKGRVHTFCHAVPGKWHLMGVMLSAGGALQWFRKLFCQQEMEEARKKGIDPYELITAAAAEVGPGAEGLLFLPYLTGERTPHKDPDAKGVFAGFSLRHSKGHMARAVMEGVAYGMRDSLDIMRDMGVPLNLSRASGGGAQSTLWRQILADTGRVSIARLEVDEGPALGAAILAGVGAGCFSSVEEACDTLIKEKDVLHPREAESVIYDDYHREFQAVYQSLQEHFKRMNALVARTNS
ncbi:MAG: xylulokinase [Candidatus Hydrogenedens sp.]|jgi:xylulokinase|nr:xylulokinase [Candidatus Hydrogenedens sp.]